jgi:hypothetical protein
MAETKYYEIEDFQFEFTPDGSPYKGILVTQFPEVEPFTSRVDLSSSRSRNVYAKEAQETCGMDVGDLKIALNSLSTKRTEEVNAAASAAQDSEEGSKDEEVDEEEINQRINKPGVLERLVEGAATFSRVIKEEEMLRLLTLVCLSAQLDLLPSGKPIGTNCILTAEAGRGKNYSCDAIARLVPEEFYFAFESSSAKALYYLAKENTAYLKHRWIYPNEAEGTDQLVEMFRPLLSGGSATHLTVSGDANGRNSGHQFTIEGPITLTIPTVRNKMNNQLQSRMLVAELKDYEGRVSDHSGAVSELLSQDYVGTDYTQQIRVWKAALRSLTGIRKVVVPKNHEKFRFDSDEVSHGARLWTNVLGLMCTHAWLEQRNREVVTLENGEEAIEATPDDYEVAYTIFKATCERSVINISDTHRKILDAVYALTKEAGDDSDLFLLRRFGQRKIQDKSRELHGKGYVRQASISENKTFLVKSAKLLWEPQEGGLALVKDADPSLWEKGDTLDGFPKPEQVRIWWNGNGSLDPTPDEKIYQPNVQDDRDIDADDWEVSDHESGLSKPDSTSEEAVIGVIGTSKLEQTKSDEDQVASIVKDEDDEQWRINEAIRECRKLFDNDPEWVPSEIYDDEALHNHAVDMLWASPLEEKHIKVFFPHHVLKALKIILRDEPESSFAASGVQG